MNGGKILDQIEIKLRNFKTGDLFTVYFDITDSSLSRKWLPALNQLLTDNYYLEKNYCFLGFEQSERNGDYILGQVNRSIQAINQANLGYTIDDHFDMFNTMTDEALDHILVVGRNLVHDKLNNLHRYFEDLQGVSGAMSAYYQRADAQTRWHIRQLNLLCHEFESWALSYRKELLAPDWRRPSQLMCWLHAPRFVLDEEDHQLFGIETLNRSLGGVYVGVNKAVGKSHWEVFNDEGRDSRISELTTTTLRNQTEAAGDFDIEWAQNPANFEWQQQRMNSFRTWLINNNFDPEDKNLTIGHPQVGQCNLQQSFGTEDFTSIWAVLNTHLDVHSIKTSDAQNTFEYHWSDNDFVANQVKIIQGT
jgi:hypothetical protein